MAFAFGGNLLDLLVLAVLKNGDTYGYVLTQRAKSVIDISDSTLYPVLHRRYYSITPNGLARLSAYAAEWESYKKQVDFILSGGMCGD